jgi:NodT family efflux transporter outer membrane factor (OMF) lipoprotein
MVGPDYKPPQNCTSDHWNSSSIKEETVSVDRALTDWWSLFKDPLLTQYIQKSVLHNYSLLAAEANILQAKWMRQVAASPLFPQLATDLNATQTYFSKNGPVFALGPATGNVNDTTSSSSGIPFTLQVPQEQSLFNALFDLSWEIDFFGKTRRAVESATAHMESLIAERDDLLISVIAEIARNYIELRGFQKQLYLLEENIALLTKKSFIIEKQLEAGYTSKLNLDSVLADLHSIQALLPYFKSQVFRNIYALSVLVGDSPEALFEELSVPKPLPSIPEGIAIGIRSELLRRRPDVRRQERNLAAATADIGVAAASFFPTVTLLGDGGFQSLSLKDLFSAASGTWAIGGDMRIPIFQGGRIVGNLRVKKAAAASAVFNYQQTVLQALQEAETTLSAYLENLQSVSSLTKTYQNNEEMVSIAEKQYNVGFIPLTELLDRKRTLNLSEQGLLDNTIFTLTNLIALYKALGGGWELYPPDLHPVIQKDNQ